MSDFWHEYSKDCKPKKNGEYFVVTESSLGRFPKCAWFANNIRKDTVDIYDKDLKTKYGFYISDREYGDLTLDNVILWAEIPDYKGEQNNERIYKIRLKK